MISDSPFERCYTVGGFLYRAVCLVPLLCDSSSSISQTHSGRSVVRHGRSLLRGELSDQENNSFSLIPFWSLSFDFLFLFLFVAFSTPWTLLLLLMQAPGNYRHCGTLCLCSSTLHRTTLRSTVCKTRFDLHASHPCRKGEREHAHLEPFALHRTRRWPERDEKTECFRY
ncbi:hypothetical protein VTO42DRAFT_1525 [Malbranchea cinnamomea]